MYIVVMVWDIDLVKIFATCSLINRCRLSFFSSTHIYLAVHVSVSGLLKLKNLFFRACKTTQLISVVHFEIMVKVASEI